LGKEHRLAQRRQAILTAFDGASQLSVAELSSRFGVSEVTIRTDLRALSRQGLLVRTRGGATAVMTQPEISFDIRQQQQAEQKARIARAAAALVRDGDAITLDASTTAMAMIPYLENRRDLTVVTNSLKAALGLLRNRHVNVIMPGGRLRRDSISLVGSNGRRELAQIHLRMGFFGARGVTLEQGLTDVNLEEAEWKRRMVANCQTIIALLDATKWGQVGVITFAQIQQVNHIIADEDAPAELVEAVRGRGVEVTIV
jgi:DeoR/GlpR family transcriptional regulator of sugar metabolism